MLIYKRLKELDAERYARNQAKSDEWNRKIHRILLGVFIAAISLLLLEFCAIFWLVFLRGSHA